MNVSSTFNMLWFAAAILSSGGVASAFQSPSCPISGIVTVDIDYNPEDYTIAKLDWLPATCELQTSIVKISPYFIGNYYQTEHYFMYGDALLAPSLPLDWPFYGHPLSIIPADIIGPFPGGQSTLAVPPDPALVGSTFYVQCIAVFITTVHFPIEPEYVLQQTIQLTFQ